MLDTLRAHRVAVVAWVVGGAAAMYVMAIAIAQEMRDFPGGARALAASIEPAAEAMRLLRWPAERLDTLGGYVTYHNVTLFTFFLSIYAALLGARVIRGSEADNSLEEVLATGWSRSAVLRDRTLGVVAILVLVSLGVGLGVAAAMAAGDEPDLSGSLATMAASGLAAFVAYALAVLVSQLVRAPRAAAGVAALVLTALYLATNVWERIGPLGVVRFASPYHYANQSRALVPGHGFDVVASVAMVVLAVGLVVAAGWLFERRDYGAAAWSRRARPTETVRPGRGWSVSPLLRTLTTAMLARGWLGLLVWTASTAAFVGAMVWMQPAVMQVWADFDVTASLAGGVVGTAEAQYLAFIGEILAPVVAAYVVTQASGWVTDLDQGRVEAVLSGPVSWARLVGERILAATVGVVAITAAGLLTMGVGAALVDSDISADGLVRLGVTCVLLGVAVAGIASVVVVWLRSGVAVTVLALYLGLAYLLTLLVPMLHWPEWVSRLSVLWAFGHPYLDWPSTTGLAVLLLLAALGGVLAAAIAGRTPKVA